MFVIINKPKMVCAACLVAPFLIGGASTGIAGKSIGAMWLLILSIILSIIGGYFLMVGSCGTSKCAIA